jgi:octaprenyl-diphosphate synthase
MNNQSLFDTFDAEIEEVQGTLLAATTDLTNPLGDLVRAQIKRAQPPICGAVVLAVSMAHGTSGDDGDLRRKRILLAAALEMLHVALNVHRLLVNAAINDRQPGGEDTLDRAFIGSTILAGDYCFSRAAQLAAHTDHARVVATFSLALQTVSEELLREQFHPDSGSYDETKQLLISGTQAAAQLVGLSEDAQQEAMTLAQRLASRWALYQHGRHGTNVLPLDAPVETLPLGWQALYHWLNRRRVNGELPLVSS